MTPTLDRALHRDLTAFRRRLHAEPELSGHEHRTHDAVLAYLHAFAPTSVVQHLGGTGLAAVFDSGAPGPTILVRAELDALPIQEVEGPAHRSTNPGVMHACGHDGHATMVAGLAPRLAAEPPSRGRVILLFQPAEETGAGAAAVLADPRWPALEPDAAIALHNLPGHPMGQVILREGVFSCASRGMSVGLEGITSHAAHPDDGVSPAEAIAELIQRMPKLPAECLPDSFGLVTITHIRAGKDAVFGVTPAEGRFNATLRTDTDQDLSTLSNAAETLLAEIAGANRLPFETTWHDEFAAAVCDPETVALVRAAANDLGLDTVDRHEPFRWSEDFGLFTRGRRGVLFGLGSGEHQPQLHNPDYDFPDDLIAVGVPLFEQIVRRALDPNAG
jgi:amidohydrolase